MESIYTARRKGNVAKSLTIKSLVLVNHIAAECSQWLPSSMEEWGRLSNANLTSDSEYLNHFSQNATSKFKVVIGRCGQRPSGVGDLAKLIGVKSNLIRGAYNELKSQGILVEGSNIGEVGMGRVLLLNTGELMSLKVIDNSALISLLVADIYKNIEVLKKSESHKGRGERLSQENSLFLALLLTHANQLGEVNNLSQAEMRSHLGFSESQLKSQMEKLISLGVLKKAVPGGVFVKKRVKSKLCLSTLLVERICHETWDSTLVKKVSSSVPIPWLRHLTDLFIREGAGSPEIARAGVELLGLELMDRYPKSLNQVMPLEKRKRHLYCNYLVKLCLHYVSKWIVEFDQPLIMGFIKKNTSERFNFIRKEKSMTTFDYRVVNSLVSSLGFENITYEDVLSYSPQTGELIADDASDVASDAQRTDDEKKSELARILKLQRLSFLRSLKSLVWALIIEVAEVLYFNDTFKEMHEIDLSFTDLQTPVVSVVQTGLSQVVDKGAEPSEDHHK